MRLILVTLFLSFAAGAVPMVAPLGIPGGPCDKPDLSFEEKAEIVSRSLEDAIQCMGADWVYGDLSNDEIVHQTSNVAALTININVSLARMQVHYPNGEFRTWLISPGVDGHRTPRGSFSADKLRLMEDAYSDRYDAPMPYSVFFIPYLYAIHGTGAEKKLGRPASHGCVRLAMANAKELFYRVKADLAKSRTTEIVIK